MKKLIALLLALVVLTACAAPTPQVVEKEVVVEKPVVQTVIVEKEKVIEKPVVETVIVEKPVVETVVVEKEKVVEKMVTPTPVAKPAIHRTLGGWDQPPAYNGNPFAPGGVGTATDYVYGMLFGYDVLKDEYWPWLGTDMDESADALTVHLRQDAKWEDGTPFTSKDIYSMFYMAGGVWGWSHIWRYVDKVEIPDDYTVIFHWSATPSIIVKKQLLTEWIRAPYHLYEQWLPDAEEIVNLRHEIWAKEAAGEDVSALNDTLSEKVNALKEKVTEFKPEKPIGYGPFKVKTVTTDEMVLEKSDTFWAADKVAFDEVRIGRYTTNELAWAQFIAGAVDLEKPATPPDMVDAILAAQPCMHHVPVPDFASFALALNTAKSPFSEKEFRQALAYILDLNKIREIAMYYGSTVEYPSGLLPSAIESWTSASFRSTLNTYAVDFAKAEELLESAGLVKGADGFWASADGTPLEFEVVAREGYSDWVLAAEEIARQLTDFGIKAKVRIVQGALYADTLRSGDYDMSIAFGVFAKFHPAQGYTRIYKDGFIASISGFDPVVVGREGETVNLADLADQLMVTTDTAEQKKIIEELAWATNEYLPIIEFLEKNAQFFVCDGVRVTGWPFGDDMQNKFAFNWRFAVVKWMADGILKPAR